MADKLKQLLHERAKLRGALAPATRSVELDSQQHARQGDRQAKVRSVLERERFAIAEFTNLYDREFLEFSYLAVLGRFPDAEAFRSRLTSVQSGSMSRVEVVARLRHSREGQARGVRISGLYRSLTVDFVSRIPILGYPVRLLRAIFYLPSLLRELELVRSSIAMNRNEVLDKVDSISDELETRRRDN